MNEKHEEINKYTRNEWKIWGNKQINKKRMKNMRKLTNLQEMNEKHEKKSSKNNKLMKEWGKNHKITINKWVTYEIIIK